MNFQQAFQFAWSDFQTAIQSDPLGLASSPSVASAISAIQDASTQSLVHHQQRAQRDPLPTGFTPVSLQHQDLLATPTSINLHGTPAIARPSGLSVSSSMMGWVCQMDGTITFVGANSDVAMETLQA
ncbi:hypothetical protein SH449x_003653 [Pirellulaceae bacterium SH449]